MPNESLKTQVHDYWNAQTCGTRYGRKDPQAELDLQLMAEARYRLEPYIPPFADFPHGAGKRLLEIGVGGGVDFHSWVRHGAIATGVDLTEAGIELTRRRLQESGVPDSAYNLRVADAEKLPFPDGSFDIVYSWGVLHHSPDTPRAFSEVSRVLAPGGEFRGMVYHVPSVVGWLLWTRFCLMRGRPWRTPRRAIYDHLESPGTKAYTVPELTRMLTAAGFSDVRAWSTLSFGDLLRVERSKKFKSPIYALIWKLYPRWLVRMLGDGFGLNLHFVARKPALSDEGDSAGAPR